MIRSISTTKRMMLCATMFGILFLGAVESMTGRGGGALEAFADGNKTTIYFTRHAEDETAIVDRDGGGLEFDCVINDVGGEPVGCCRDVLSELGELRAKELAR